MITKADPGALGCVANAVESLDPAVKLVTLLVKSSSRLNLQVLACVPIATLRLSSDLFPDSLQLSIS